MLLRGIRSPTCRRTFLSWSTPCSRRWRRVTMLSMSTPLSAAAATARRGSPHRAAADLIASLPERQLAELIGELGEERFARRVARAIGAAQRRQPLRWTLELAEVVRAAVPTFEPGQDPATRTFQALRIAVNDELGE